MKTTMNDLTGKRFGRLRALAFSHKNKFRTSYWECECDCGSKKTVRGSSLSAGRIRSCGCLPRQKEGGNGRKHGKFKHRLYHTWNGMISRCKNPNSPSYRHYGGRGIVVCERWKNIDNFIKDMESSYEKGLSIERVDNDGPYSPENCRWATRSEQARNTQGKRMVQFQGQEMHIYEVCEIVGVDPNLVTVRIYQRGWDLEKALYTPKMF